MAIIQTRVARATVFRNGALVVRTGVATGAEVEVHGLPLLYASDSLRVRPARGEVADLRETAHLETRPTPPPPSESEVRRLALEAERLVADEQILNARAALFESLAPPEPPAFGRARLPDASQWAALGTWATARLAGLDAAREDLRRRQRTLARARYDLERASKPDPEPPRFSRGIRFRVDAADAGEIPLEIEYFVAAARWFPTWRLDVAGDRAALSLDALVAQATGEDWEDAELRFATADLARETTLPELMSWRIGARQAQPRPAFRPLPDDLPLLFTGYDRGRSGPGGGPAPALRPEPAPIVLSAPPPDLDDSDEPTGVTMAPPMADLAVDDARFQEEAGAPMPPRRPAPAPKSRARGAAMPAAPPPAMSMMAMAPPAPMANMASMALGGAPGGGGGGGYGGPAVPEPPAELPPRLRFAYLRLAGPDETGRGTLRPVDPLTHLGALVEQHVVDPAALKRAVEALRRAAQTLRRGPAPAGTTPLEQCHFHQVYEAQGPQSLPGDGEYHRLFVQREEAPVRHELRGVPRESRDLFRYCVFETTTGVARPTGPLQVSVGGEFRVTSQLDGEGGGRPLELNLGLEPAVRVTDRLVDTKQEDKGLMTQTTRVDHRVTVRLRSSLPRPEKVVLFDRLPVAGDNERDVEVTLQESRPEATRDDRGPHDEPLDGGLHWTLTVPPGGTAQVEYRYRVSAPAKIELDGGNRRE